MKIVSLTAAMLAAGCSGPTPRPGLPNVEYRDLSSSGWEYNADRIVWATDQPVVVYWVTGDNRAIDLARQDTNTPMIVYTRGHK
jgi:hypothetical protein